MLFSIVQLWRLVSLEPLGVQRRYVPHQGLIMLYLDSEAQGRSSTFTVLHALLKKAILLHTTVRFSLSICVPIIKVICRIAKMLPCRHGFLKLLVIYFNLD